MLLQAVEAVPAGPHRLPWRACARAARADLERGRGDSARATDGDRLFHVVALEGASPRERRSRAQPDPLAAVKSIVALGAQHSLSQTLGFRWLHSGWIPNEDSPAGVFLAARTERRMTEADGVCSRTSANDSARVSRKPTVARKTCSTLRAALRASLPSYPTPRSTSSKRSVPGSE